MTNNSPENSQFTITLLRHGESTGNVQGLYQGQSDYPLSETGIAQAHALAKHWLASQITFDRIFSSPLQRAAQTAAILSKELQIPVTEESLWMEGNNGHFEGKVWKEIESNNLHNPQARLFDPIGEIGESNWDLYLRAGAALQSIYHQPPGKYLVVSHVGILNMVLHAALGIAPQPGFRGVRFRFQNTAYAVLHYRGEQQTLFVECLNERSHWERK